MKRNRPKTPRREADGDGSRKPQRTCVSCRKVLDQDLLVRYVLSPQGAAVVDYRRRLPGRGAYTCLDRQCLENAVKRGQLSRALKLTGPGPSVERLWLDLAEQSRQRVVNLLGMARKAGCVVSGTRLVLGEMSAGRLPGLVLLATDLSPAMAEKVRKAACLRGIVCHALLSKNLLGQLMGKSERGTLAVKPGLLADTIRDELERLKTIAGES